MATVGIKALIVLHMACPSAHNIVVLNNCGYNRKVVISGNAIEAFIRLRCIAEKTITVLCDSVAEHGTSLMEST